MVLHLHRAPRTDLLADALGELLSTPLDDPFAQEVVVVPAKGVERWVTQRLSHRLGTGARGGDGVCAGVRFLQPTSLVSLLLGRERDDAWDPDRLVWPLLETIDASLGEPWCDRRSRSTSATVATARPASCGATAATRWRSGWPDLFATYAAQRPQLVTDWREGRDTDGAGHSLEADLVWQAELWRRLLARVPEDPPDVRHRRTLERLDAGGDGLDLPARLSLFGHTRLPVTEVELLAALGRAPRRTPLPAAALAGAVGRARPTSTASCARDDDTSADRVGHPLLASLGRDAARAAPHAAHRRLPRGRLPARSRQAEPATLLGWLQHDLRANHAPTVQERAHRQLAERRPQPPGARLPRRRTPGRRAARGPGRAARGRPDARAPRHPGHVP